MTYPVRIFLCLLLVPVVGCGGMSEAQPTVAIDLRSIELGSMPCNVDGVAQTIPLTNGGPGTLVWSARIEGPFVVDGVTSGSVAAGGTSEIAFRSRIPSSTPLYGSVDGAIIVSTNDPANREIRIPVHAVATGASLHSTPTVDVGEAPIGGHADGDVRIENKGDFDVDVEVGTPTVALFSTLVPKFTMAAKSSGPATGFRFSPISLGNIDATVPIRYRGPVCDAPRSEWSLRGHGVNGIAVSPGTIDYGLVDCGTVGKPQPVKITNPTSFPAGVYVAFGSPDRFEPIPSFTLPPGDTAELPVVPKQLPPEASTAPNAFGDTMTITTNVSGDYPHVVKLEQTAYGAVLSMPATTNAGRVLIDAAPNKTVSIALTNSGNAPAQVSGSTNGATATFPQSAIAAGATVNVTATLTADPKQIGRLDTRSLSYAISGPVCGSDVPQISMTPYDTAIDLAGLQAVGDVCILGHSHRVYCGGSDYPNVLPDLDLIVGASGDAVFQSGQTVCLRSGAAITCGYGLFWSNPTTYPLPPGTTRVFLPPWGNFHLCAFGAPGTLQCMGYDSSYEFGNGTQSGQFLPWQPAMIGLTGITDYAGTDYAGLVLVGGSVYGAGSNGASNGLLLGVDYQVAPTPVQLAGLSNVTRIDGSPFECAALHADGTVSLWDKGGIHHPVAGIVDGIEVQAVGGRVCVIRQTGGVRCSDNGNPPNVLDAIGIATPAQKITPALILEANGAVSYWQWPQLFKVHGFEGP